jgi:hypothetical protein
MFDTGETHGQDGTMGATDARRSSQKVVDSLSRTRKHERCHSRESGNPSKIMENNGFPLSRE